MQLKSLGNLSIAMDAIKEAPNNFKMVSDAVKILSTQNTATALTTSTLTKAQQIQILINKGVTAEEAKQAVATATLSASQEKATLSTKNLGLAWKGLASKLGLSVTQLNIAAGALAAVAVGMTVYKQYKQYLEELSASGNEAAGAFENVSSTIEDYTDKYKELRTALINAKGNEEETYNIKKQLLDLQTELNGKFGEEYGKLNLVTDAYKDQTEAIKAYNAEAAKTFLNENEEEIRTATKRMTAEKHYNLSYTGNSAFTDEGKALKEVAEQFKDSGITLLDELGTGDYSQFSVHLTADAQSAYETINAFESALREKAEELGNEHMFDDVLEISSSGLNQAKSIIDDWGQIYKQSLLAEIASSESLSSEYNKAVEAVQNYNEAVLQSENPYNDDNVKSAYDSLQTIKAGIQENEEEWGKYSTVTGKVFDEALTGSYEFYNDIKANSQNLIDDITGLTDIELLSMSSDEQEDSFNKLCESAEKYGMSIQDVIDMLVHLGIAQRDIQDSSIDIPPSHLSISNTIDQLNTHLKPAFDSLKSAYQDIFTEDGFTIKNADFSMLNNIKSSINELNSIEGIDVDYASYENLVKILNETAPAAEDVQKAFNELTSSITRAGLTGTEDFKTLASALEDFGIENSEMVAFDNLISNTEALKEAGLDLATATDDEIEAFLAESVSAEYAGQALALLQLKKMLVNGTLLDTSTDINNVLALANAAGITSNALSQLASAKAFYDSAVASGNAGRIDSATAQLNSLNTQIQDDIANFKPEVKFDGNSGKSSASKAGKEAADAYLEAFNEELKELDDLKDQGKISEKEYLDALRLLYERYFKNIDKYAKEFADNQAKYLDGMASMYESVFSYISNAIGKRISALGDERDAQVDSLKAQQEAAEESYQAEIDGIDDAIKALEKKKDAIQDQIDAKQDEIDAIKKASEARQREIDLQKALYDLVRKQNQRNILQYSDDKGMNYVNDTSGLRDAREEAKKKQEEIDIAKIENEIDLLEKAQDQIDDQIDSLNERKDAIESMIDASNAYFESQIEATEKYFDALIESMEKQQSKWDELLELKNQAEMMALLEQLGITEEQILNDSGAAYETFKNQYLSVLRDMYDGNDSILAQFDRLTGMDVSGMTGYIEATAEAFNGLSEGTKSLDDLSAKADNAKKSVEGLASAISGTGSAKANNTGIANPAQGQKGQAASGGSLADAIQDLPSVGHEEFDASIQEILTVLDEFISNLEEKWQQVTDITANALTGGSGGENKEKPASGDGTSGTAQKKGGEEKEGSAGGVIGILQQAVKQADSLLNGEDESFMSAFNTLLEEDPTLSETWETISTIFSDACTAIIEDLTSVMAQIDAFIAKCGELETGGEGNPLLSNFNFGFTGKGYASGTRNAKQGTNLIGEDGAELYKDNDGNVGLATAPTLVGMEGGETVYNAFETKDILSNSSGNDLLLPHIRNFDAMMELFDNARYATPSFADNISKDYMNNINRNMNLIQNSQKTQTSSVNIGDIVVQGVQDTTGFARAVKAHFPNAMLQEIHMR